MAPFEYDPKSWRERAEEMISLADQAKDEMVRYTLLGIAAGYELMAQTAERRFGAP